MKLTPEELKRLIKGIPVEHVEDNDLSLDYGLDKDDCLGRSYPGVSDEVKSEEVEDY